MVNLFSRSYVNPKLMTPTIFAGLLAATFFGLANFVARGASRHSGVLVTLFWGQIFLAAMAAVALCLWGRIPDVTASDWAWLVASSSAIIGATGCLYRGLAVGRLSVVAPVMASYGAVSAGLSVIAGDHLSARMATGILFTIAGAVLSAVPTDARSSNKSSGWVPATGAAVLFGVGYWLQGRYVIPAFGPIPAIAFYYVTAMALMAATALVVRQNVLDFEGARGMGRIIVTAALGGGGFAAVAFAQSQGHIAIATALSSAATAITVLLALMFLRERPGWTGWAGVASVMAGVTILQFAQ